MTAGLILVAALTGAAGVELKRYSLDTLDGVLTKDGVRIDRTDPAEGSGSLRVDAAGPATVRLFETGDLDVETASLVYRARLRTRDLKGDAYLEMWCQFPGKGEYFSRGLQYSLSGTHAWAGVETPFFLRKGENPDNVRLNLVVTGPGRVWIDDVRLEKAPLPEE
jgi:hypothetical protein